MAIFDTHRNLSFSTVAVAPSPALSGTSLDILPGDVALFAGPPFNCTVSIAGAEPSSTTAEIVRVTGIAGSTLTIVRAQEGTTAIAIAVGDQIAMTVTAKAVQDIESAVTDEVLDRTSADALLASAIDLVSNSVSVEAAARVAGDDAVSAAVDVVSGALANETSARTAALNAVSNAVSVLSSLVAGNSAQMVSADNAISAAVNTLSAVVSNRTSAIVANSAQMTSADNAVSLAAAAVSSRLDSAMTVVSNLASAVVANSAQMTSADNANSAAINALSAVVSNRTSAIAANSAQMTSADNANAVAVNAISDRLSTWRVDDLADVSAPSPADGQVVMWKSASAQWVASTPAGGPGGSGSVTSADFVSLRGLAQTNSAQMTSADNAISAAGAALSLDHVSLVSDVGRMSLNLSALSTRADAISALASNAQSVANAVSVRAADLTSNLAAVSLNLSALSTRADAISVLASNAQSVANAASAAVAVVSANHTSLVSDVGRMSLNLSAISTRADAISLLASNAQSIANAASIVAADAASVGHAASAAAAAVSANQTSLVSDVGRISLNLSALSTRADAISVLASNAQSVANAASIVAADALSAARAASANLTSVLSNQISNLTSNVNAVSVVAADALSAARAASANITSVLSNQVSLISANHVSLVSDVGRISVAVAAGLVSAGPVKKVLAGAQLVTATALVSVSGFTFACSAGVAYGMEFMLFTSSPISLAHPQYQFSTSGLGAPNNFLAELMFAGGPAATNATVYCSVGIRNSAMVTVSAVGVNRATRIRGGFVASAAGKLKLKVGNNISGAGVGSAITIAAGSYGYVWRMG